MTPLDKALAYAAAGWPVFPCRHQDEFDPETGEVLGSVKTPLTPNGLKDATIAGRIIERRWEKHPDALIGGPTGEVMNAFVLDIDVKPGIGSGFDWLDEMEAEYGRLPETARVATVNGGRHYYFTYRKGIKNRGNLGPLTDIRGEGGYVILPGSVLADGRKYEWHEWDQPGIPPIVEAPDWLIDLLLQPARESKPTEYAPRQYGDTNTAYVTAAIDHELAELASVPLGAGRNNALNDASFAIGQFVGAGAISRGEAESALEGIFGQWDNVPKSRGTMKSGLDAGTREPRQIPAPTQQDNTRLIDVSRMIENGLRKAAAARGDTHGEPEAPAAAPEEKPPETAKPTAPAPKKNEPFQAHPFTWIDPKTLPRRSFAFGVHYIRKYVSVTVAPGGLGKTANSIVDALAMTSKRPLAGTAPRERLRVWLFNAEDPRDELERRIMAACLHYRLKPEDINGHLFLDTGREQEMVIARDDKQGVKINEPIVEAVVAQILMNQIDVMIVDPFVSTHGVNENDNGAIDKVAKLWAQIADRTNCSIDIVHHLRKQQDGREATVEDARGAVSLIGAARSVRVLNRMSEDQAVAGGLNPMDRFGYFSITYGKSNLTPLSHKADWRHLVGQALGNGGTRNLGWLVEDFAPVVTEWKWPGSEDIVGSLTPEQALHIRTLLDNGDYKPAANAKNWAGNAVAYALGIDTDDKSARHRATGVLRALLKEGELVEVRERDPISRKDSAFIRSSEYVPRG